MRSQADGKFWAEADGKTLDRAEARYVLRLKAIDFSGEAWLNVLGQPGEDILGMKADELAVLKKAADSRMYRYALFCIFKFFFCGDAALPPLLPVAATPGAVSCLADPTCCFVERKTCPPGCPAA